VEPIRADRFESSELRDRLKIPHEPEIRPGDAPNPGGRLGRFNLIPVERLDDEKLVSVYLRARVTAQQQVQTRAGRH